MSGIMTREEQVPGNTWDLSSLYKDELDWDKDLNELKSFDEKIGAYEGTLGRSAKGLREFLDLTVEVGLLEERLGYYAMLRQSEDAGNSANQVRYSKYMQVAARISAAMSFFAPELHTVPQEKLDSFLQTDELQEYRISLHKVLRFRPHTLSPAEEKLLAMQQEANQTASQSFRALVDVDIDFGRVDTPEGPRHLSQSSFVSLLEHTDRDVRRRSHTQFYSHFESHKNTLTSLFTGNINLDIYLARARGFDSALEAKLFPDDVPTAVYDNLVSTVRSHLPTLHRYYQLRKRASGLTDFAVYDARVPLVPSVSEKRSYDEAVETVSNALSPLGDEYVHTLKDGLLRGWVDRYENKGKRSGAFSAGSYQGNPYILMNYKDDSIRDMFTLAHEGGHSMHSWYSVRSNPFQHYNYTIFEAEVASTFNEQLLMQHLLKETNSDKLRTYLISKHLEDMLGTLFRQTMFAEYERTVHEYVESGNALSVDWLREQYSALLNDYFGPDVVIPENLDLEGLRIPHFYRSFYVYKYATGISAAIALAQHVLEGGTTEREAYFLFLRSGGSRFPIESLKLAGVDMTSSAPVEEAMGLFARRLDELANALSVQGQA
ncbi:MAG: oligoendopeptidase F [Alkalispirochaeta sp.]